MTTGARVPNVKEDTADSLITFLRGLGADNAPHAGGRTLLDHLTETQAIVRRWGQPEWLQHAALAHSVYGTDAYHRQLLSLDRRHELAEIIGERAERIIYLFCVTPRRPLFAGTHRWARDMPARDELDPVLLLHMANLADQAQATDGSPGRWLTQLKRLGELIADSETVHPPPVLEALATISDEDEQEARTAYLTGQFALAAATCPVIAEPCILMGWRSQARARLERLGTAWDKRLSYDEWSELAERLPQGGSTTADFTHPRALLDAVRDHRPRQKPGRGRFHRYVDGLTASAPIGIYPDLPSQPWYEPQAFETAQDLESHYAEIRQELLALDPTRFHTETESIPRTGEWDVLFFYERGRPNRHVIAACPVTARALESQEAIRTPIGLAYLSRMRPGTHIARHRGPTNLRVRCHLGIQTPDGDCAIRVDNETRAWQNGKCLVFDDHFEHEAWNHTTDDRIVLIVDLWHPDLTTTEVAMLEGLQRQMYDYALRLTRYWSGNESAQNPKSPPKSPPPKSPPSPNPPPSPPSP